MYIYKSVETGEKNEAEHMIKVRDKQEIPYLRVDLAIHRILLTNQQEPGVTPACLPHQRGSGS